MVVISPLAQPDEQALIAEARAHARRRRWRAVLVLVVVLILASAGVLIARAAAGPRHAAPNRPRPGASAVPTGTVTGRMAACIGAAPINGALRVTPGTVAVLRGSISWKPDGPGTWRMVLPKGPVVARGYISNNYDQVFRFALPPGHYVLVGSYRGSVGPGTFNQAMVAVGKVVRVNLPDDCK
jgi:hypothetical protein